MAKITLAQQDELNECLSKAVAILECFSSAIDPSAPVILSKKSTQDIVWALSDLVYKAHRIISGESTKEARHV